VKENVTLVLRHSHVLLVLLDIKQMGSEDAQLVIPDITPQQMVLLVPTAPVANTQIQPQALVQAAVVAVPLALQLHPVVSAALDMAIYLDYALDVMRELIQQAEPIPVKLVAQEHILL